MERGWSSDVVEGSQRHVLAATERYKGNEQVRIIHSMFSEFVPDTSYDTIIAGDILRYITDPVEFLRRLASSLATNGVMIITVPNSFSLHRRIGTLMRLEDHPCDANARDRQVGNLRTYDRYRLRSEILKAGLSIAELRGCFLKPLSSAQMQDWDDRLLRALLEVGDELPDFAWFLYAICNREHAFPALSCSVTLHSGNDSNETIPPSTGCPPHRGRWAVLVEKFDPSDCWNGAAYFRTE